MKIYMIILYILLCVSLGVFVYISVISKRKKCKVDKDCSKGVCLDNLCVDCKTDEECPKGVCLDNSCVECKADGDCHNGVCVNNTCVDCKADGDCPYGVCLSNTCVDCKADGDCSNGKCTNNSCITECTENDECPISGQVCGKDNSCVDCKTDGECSDKQVCVYGKCGNFTRGYEYSEQNPVGVKVKSPYECVDICEKDKNCTGWNIKSGKCYLYGENNCTFQTDDNIIGDANAKKSDTQCEINSCPLTYDVSNKKCNVDSDCGDNKTACRNGDCYGPRIRNTPYWKGQVSCGFDTPPNFPRDKFNEMLPKLEKACVGKNHGDKCSIQDYSQPSIKVGGVCNMVENPDGVDFHTCIPEQRCFPSNQTTFENKRGKCMNKPPV
jgi:hypothetical protein